MDRYGVAAEVQILGVAEPRLSPEIETVLYRVVQEALTNVLKHAQATNVSIVYDRRPAELRVVIEDDGRGFDVEDAGGGGTVPDGRRRLGLSGMRERLAMIGGVLRVESSSAGTTAFVRMAIDRSSVSPRSCHEHL